MELNLRIKYLDGKRFYRALLAGGRAVIRNQGYLNRINVFPVADADTGINLAQTMQAIIQRSRIGNSLKETLHSVADSALTGARGNSGIIFAQYLHGLSRELPEKASLEVQHFAESAQKAVKHLYASLLSPVEGTMLTVIREWAENLVEQSKHTADFFHALNSSLTAAQRSLKETPQKLKVLAEHGVVDAGASGFVNFLEGVLEFIQKGSLRSQELSLGPELPVQAETHASAPERYRYCTEALLSGCSLPLDQIRDLASPFGDSLILAGGQDKLHLHIHTNEPDRLFAELFKLGEVSGAKVDDMLRQYQVSHDRKFPIAIITDSACDLPLELLDHHQIIQIPFGINFGERAYLDKLTIRPDSFYQMLKTDPVHPVSSQPPPATVRTAFETACANYGKVIAVHISEKLSGVYQTSTNLAATEYADKVKVINSRQLSVTEGLVTLRIARAVEAGMDFDQIVNLAPKWAENTKIYTDINTLRYMVRGGRVKPLTGLIAAALNLKPIVSLDPEGKAEVFGKSFSRKSNLRKIIGIIKAQLEHRGLWEYAIVHAAAEQRAWQYAKLLTEITGRQPAYVMPLSPVVGVHNGIGTVGIGVAYD